MQRVTTGGKPHKVAAYEKDYSGNRYKRTHHSSCSSGEETLENKIGPFFCEDLPYEVPTEHRYMDEENLLEANNLDEDDPDEEKEELRDIRKTYQRTIILMMPKSSRVSFLLKSKGQLFSIILQQFLISPTWKAKWHDDILQICNILLKSIDWKHPTGHMYNEADYIRLISGVCKLDNRSVLARALPLVFHDGNVFNVAQATIERYGSTWLEKCLDEALRSVDDLYDRGRIIEEVTATLPNPLLTFGLYQSLLSSFQPKTEYLASFYDAEMLARIAVTWSQDELLHTCWIPTVKKFSDNTRFMLELMGSSFRDKKRVLQHLPEPVFKELLPVMAKHLDPINKQHHSAIAAISCRMHRFGLTLELVDINAKITQTAKSSDRQELMDVYVPFLQRLVAYLRGWKLLHAVPFQTMFRSILKYLVDACAKLAPRSPPGTWERMKYSCGCRKCQVLDEFLVSPTITFFTYSRSTPGREHLEKRLKQAKLTQFLEVNTERNSVPWALVVRKTDPMYEKQRIEWEVARNRAKAAIAAMCLENLRVLLGDEFESIMTLKATTQVINLVKEEEEAGVLAIKTESGMNATAELKRKQPHPDALQNGSAQFSENHFESKRVCSNSSSPPPLLYQIPEYPANRLGPRH
ncbi:uncharacterized protein LY89DRAFT_152721 [Mollisia scopiformis]|uniref:Uncharacterized protein n=1 Tax=Mollisia scopiformis TaxID=149040 RepID=A0A194X1L3_MOLSC|nr:uncharacterized protein LY89DRAFT_152721 [Mollisia scopiformis]KUJ14086.1 hypothetical protein LY89DRAFT_152721 [Mollisia scopiformis]